MKKHLVVLLAIVLLSMVPGISFASSIQENYSALRQDPTQAAAIYYARDWDNRSNIIFTEAPWGSAPVPDLKSISDLVERYNLQYRGVWKALLPDGVSVLVHLFAFYDGSQWKYFALVPEDRWQNRYDRTHAVATFERAEDEFVDLISLSKAVEECYPGQKVRIGVEGKLFVGRPPALVDGPRAFLVNGKEVILPHYAVHGTTYVGVELIAKLLGADAQFSGEGKEARVGSATFKAGQPTKYGVTRYEHALVVPLRAFCEAVGATVEYNPSTDTVNILTPDGKGPYQWWDGV